MAKAINTILNLKDRFSSPLKKTTDNTKKFTKQAKLATSQIKRMSNTAVGSFKSMAKGAIGLGAAYMGFSSAKNFLADSVTGAKAQIEAETKLSAVLKNTKGMTDKHIEGLKKYASAQQNIGVIGDEVTISGMQQLGTFQLQASTIEKLTPGMLDLLAQTKGLNATQQDATQIGNLFGKVMNGQVGALSRVGINFTKAQEKVLKFGTEEEKAATLAEVLKMNVGGVNDAMAKTDQGKIQQMTNSWGDYKEEVGKKVLPIMANVANWFFSKIPKIQTKTLALIDTIVKVSNSIRKNMVPVLNFVSNNLLPKVRAGWLKMQGPIKEISEKILPVLNSTILKTKNIILDSIKVMIDMFNYIKTNWSTIKPFIIGLSLAWGTYKTYLIATQTATLLLAAKTKILAVAQGALNAVMNANPIGLIITAIGLLIGAGILLYQNWDTIKAKAFELWGSFKTTFSQVPAFFNGVFESAKSSFRSFINFFVNGLNRVIDGMNGLKFNAPDWLPIIGGKKFSMNIPRVPAYASGTSYSKGGLAQIHEKGGELRQLSSGETIIPADKSKKIINNNNNTDSPIIIQIYGNVYGVDDLVNIVGSAISNRVKLARANM